MQLRKLKWKYETYKINRRYRILNKCNLPFGFYDKRKEKYEWVSYIRRFDNTSGYENNTLLMDALENICKVGLTYHYTINNDKNRENYQSHSHNFDGVLNELYNYPESFYIPKEYKDNYSKQELNFIEEMQKYLLFIGLKDWKNSERFNLTAQKLEKILSKEKIFLKDKIKIAYLDKKAQKINYSDKLIRCHNERQAKYQNYSHLIMTKEKIEDILENRQNFLIYYLPFLNNDKNYSTIKNKYLLKDEAYNILGSIEVIDNKIIKFKDFEKTIGKSMKNFSNYKKDLKKLYKDFNEDNLIIYEKIKVLEKF